MTDLSSLSNDQLMAMLQQHAPATTGAEHLSDDELLAALGKKPEPKATDGMSTTDKVLAGVGQGMNSVAQGAEQLAARAPWLMAALGNPSAAFMPQGAKQDVDSRVAETAKLDKALLDTTPGKVGSFAGQAAATLPLAGVGGPAEGFIANALKTGAQGAAAAAFQPVQNVQQDKTLSDLVTGGSSGGDNFAQQKLQQMGAGAAFGAGGGTLLKGAGSVLESLLPSNATARALNAFNAKSNATPFASEGEKLAQDTGVMLTPGQISGSKVMAGAENAARQSAYSRDIAFEGDKNRIGQLSEYFQKTMDGISKSNADPVTVGNQVRAATQNVIGTLEKTRSDQAAKDFGAIRQMTQGQAAINPTNTAQLLSGIAEENAGIGTPGGDALANFAKKQLANVSPAGDAPAQGNLDKIMQLRSYLSKVAGGQAKISGENQDRKVAAQLLGTIDQDIDHAGNTLGGDLGGALKTANANYRQASQAIDSVHASPLGKILGEDFSGALQSGQFNSIAPEVVSQRLGALKPSQLSVVRGILEKQDPDTWAVMKRGILEDALEKSKQMPASAGANTPVLRPTQLVKNLGDAQKLQAVFDPHELSQINAALDVSRRLSDSTGYNFSGTAGQSEMLNIMNNPITAAKDLANKGIGGLMQAGTAGLGSRAIANLMTNSQGRAALLQLKTLPPASAKARELTAYLASIVGAEGASQPNQAQ